MKKKMLTLLLAVTCAIFCSACAAKEGGSTDNSTPKETDAVNGVIILDTKAEESDKTKEEETDKAEAGETSKTEAGGTGKTEAGGTDETKVEESDKTETDGGEYEYPSEDAGEVVQKSPLGYSMTYDPTVFTLDDTGEPDVFTYNTAENLQAPVYISILPYPDMNAQILADGLVLQSGIDGVEAYDVFFGADGLEAKRIYIERENDGMTQRQIFYVLPKGEGSLLVEIGTYVGVPENVDKKFEEMLETFSLTAE